MSAKPTLDHINALYQERTQIEAWLDPKPDPAVWPPKGWQVHPQNPAFLVRIVEADKLREELFGSPERDSNIILAKARLAEIAGLQRPEIIPDCSALARRGAAFPSPPESGCMDRRRQGAWG